MKIKWNTSTETNIAIIAMFVSVDVFHLIFIKYLLFFL